jgi:divinyl chlorophyllide a 8-vinyl-reductase
MLATEISLLPPRVPGRVLVLGATGTIGRATVAELRARGYQVVCLVRSTNSQGLNSSLNSKADIRTADVEDPQSLDAAIGEDNFDAVISCLASRTGAPQDAWKIDHAAQLNVLAASRRAAIPHFILLSAICVQKPLLAFQHAKLAFEKALIESGVTYSIVRPTAFFKSLSGQVESVRQGKPFLLFGDGKLTACKPISDHDLAAYLVDCISDEGRKDQILPIGGPGEAITPLQQGEYLFSLFGKTPKYRRMPVGLLDTIIKALNIAGKIIPSLADKAEFARIGRYYATESMLVWNAAEGTYDAAATPSTGSETLFDYYSKVSRGEESAERGEHAVF